MHMHTVGLVHQLHHCTIVCIPGTRVLSDPADVQDAPSTHLGVPTTIVMMMIICI